MAIYTRIQASDLEKIVAPYQIEVVDFTPIEGGNTNSNYHIQVQKGEYMLTIVEEKSLLEVQRCMVVFYVAFCPGYVSILWRAVIKNIG